MDTTSHIKNLAKLQLVTLVLIIFSSSYLEAMLPLPLQEYLVQSYDKELSTKDSILASLMVFIGLAALASLFGLITEKRWAKPVFTYSFIIYLPISLWLDPTVEHSVSAAIGSLDSVLTGMTFALLYFTPSAFGDPIGIDTEPNKSA